MPLPNVISNKHLRRAITLWAGLALAVSVKTACVGGDHSVFPVFAAGSRHWWADMSLYANYTPTEHIDGYRYSPTFAVAFTPLALLPERAGIIAWDLFGHHHAGLGTTRVGARRAAGRMAAAARSMVLILTLTGSAVGIWSAQSNAILPAVAMFGLAAIMRRRLVDRLLAAGRAGVRQDLAPGHCAAVDGLLAAAIDLAIRRGLPRAGTGPFFSPGRRVWLRGSTTSGTSV